MPPLTRVTGHRWCNTHSWGRCPKIELLVAVVGVMIRLGDPAPPARLGKRLLLLAPPNQFRGGASGDRLTKTPSAHPHQSFRGGCGS